MINCLFLTIYPINSISRKEKKKQGVEARTRAKTIVNSPETNKITRDEVSTFQSFASICYINWRCYGWALRLYIRESIDITFYSSNIDSKTFLNDFIERSSFFFSFFVCRSLFNSKVVARSYLYSDLNSRVNLMLAHNARTRILSQVSRHF